MSAEILVVDDESDIRELVGGILQDEGFSVRTDGKSSSADWSQLWYWEEYKGVLRLSARDLPPVYLAVQRLREAGVYERVLQLSRANGKEFDAPGA